MGELKQSHPDDQAAARRAEAIVEALRSSGRSVATAESCSIGHIGRYFAGARGASRVYLGSVIAYTKRSKQRGLGVSDELLTGPMGAVTRDVAIAMAEGVLDLMGASIAVATTGVAGPTPDEDGNPVGMLVVAIAEQGKASAAATFEFRSRDVDDFNACAVSKALEMVAERLGLDMDGSNRVPV
ncbi:CinA family protein [Phreatobacter sp.]|uniref:CinA family protein n=1 Tax=Phreatobacter sp. TaxID=1966341 RepID=UPI0025D947A1|nr:CinA family protein [Phreatobacter sp.]